MTASIRLHKAALLPAACLAATFAAGLFIYGKEASAGAAAGLSLCGQVVIPSLFPFMTAALFLSKSGLSDLAGRLLRPAAPLLFKLPAAAGGSILLSFIAGYPVGARLVRGLYESGQVDESQANTLLAFTVNAGPAFVVTAVGQGMLHNRQAGWLLLAVHILASLLLGCIIGHIDGRGRPGRALMQAPPSPRRPGPIPAFVEAVSDASLSMLQICGWVVLFSVVLALLQACGLPAGLVTLLAGLSEVTTGAAAAASPAALPLLAALLGWAGLSVQFQVLSSLGSLRPKYGRFFAARAAHGLLSALLTRLLIPLFPAVTAAAARPAIQPAASGLSLPTSLAMLLLLVVFLCFARKGREAESPVQAFTKSK